MTLKNVYIEGGREKDEGSTKEERKREYRIKGEEIRRVNEDEDSLS